MHNCRTTDPPTQFEPIAEQLVSCSDYNRSYIHGSSGINVYLRDQSLSMKRIALYNVNIVSDGQGVQGALLFTRECAVYQYDLWFLLSLICKRTTVPHDPDG